MIHYDLTPQQRTQRDGRYHNVMAPLCATGDGHYFGVNPNHWSGSVPAITCPVCVELLPTLGVREYERATAVVERIVPPTVNAIFPRLIIGGGVNYD